MQLYERNIGYKSYFNSYFLDSLEFMKFEYPCQLNGLNLYFSGIKVQH